MDNEPIESIELPIHSITMYKTESGIWCIKDEHSGVATQGNSKSEALLMLTDALAGYHNKDEDLMELSEKVFTRESEDL